MDKKELDNIELRSEEIQDIIGKSPNWLLRSGITVLFVVVLLILIGSFIFKYPDIKEAPIVVMSQNPPAYITARSTGKIDYLFIADKQQVKIGEVLGIIENTAEYNDAFQLKKALQELDGFLSTFDTMLYAPLDGYLKLGEIQSDYSRFLKLYNDYIGFIQLEYYPKKIGSLQEEIRLNRIYVEKLEEQWNILSREAVLADSKFKRDSSLYRKGVLSELDYEKAQTEILQKKYGVNGAATTLAVTRRETAKLRQELVSMQKEYSDQTKKNQLGLIEALNVLKSRLAYWEKQYVLRSPIAGSVSFTEFWSQNQQLKAGDIVFTIIPHNESNIIGRASLSVAGAGKVEIGQQVNVKLENFPYMEYGMVKGIVRNISQVPSNNYYIVEVDFPNGLKTNYNIELTFSQEMKGQAEIVTRDLRLIQRIINPVRALLRHRVTE